MARQNSFGKLSKNEIICGGGCIIVLVALMMFFLKKQGTSSFGNVSSSHKPADAYKVYNGYIVTAINKKVYLTTNNRVTKTKPKSKLYVWPYGIGYSNGTPMLTHTICDSIKIPLIPVDPKTKYPLTTLKQGIKFIIKAPGGVTCKSGELTTDHYMKINKDGTTSMVVDITNAAVFQLD